MDLISREKLRAYCANGNLRVRAMYLDGGIVFLRDRNTASGYFDINYCPICGWRVSK